MTDRKGTQRQSIVEYITTTRKTKDRVTRTHLKNATKLGRMECSRSTRDTYKFRILETQCNVHSITFFIKIEMLKCNYSFVCSQLHDKIIRPHPFHFPLRITIFICTAHCRLVPASCCFYFQLLSYPQIDNVKQQFVNQSTLQFAQTLENQM